MNGLLFFPADEQESHHYPALHNKVAAGIGHGPRSMLADRDLHTQEVFELNTRRGTATIIPWREPTSDEHGVPRCRHCGGSNEGGGLARRQALGFYIADKGDPALAVHLRARDDQRLSRRPRASPARRSGGCC
jgi:hypothetical protein